MEPLEPGAASGGRPGQLQCPNRWCRQRGRGFSVAFSLGVYGGALRRAIASYKYRGERGLAPVFAAMVARFVRSHPAWFEEFALITGVPGYSGPGARRGWDPMGAILDELGPMVEPGWPVVPGLVVKTGETPAMTGLAWADRQAVARGPLRRVLSVADPAVGGAQVLVLDDVFTDGSTLREVAAVLRRAGASDVAALVLARSAWTFPGPRAVPTAHR